MEEIFDGNIFVKNTFCL